MAADESRPASPSAPTPELGLWAAASIMLPCTLFGADAVAIKVAFEGFGIFTAAVIRFTLAALVIALWAVLGGRSFRLQKGQWRYLLIYSMLFALPFLVLGLAYQTFLTASYGFIAWNALLKTYGAVALHSFVFVMPLAGVVLSGWLLGDLLYLYLWMAIVLIAAGILVLRFRPPEGAVIFPLRRHM